jgi:hypothetical protein
MVDDDPIINPAQTLLPSQSIPGRVPDLRKNKSPATSDMLLKL